MGGLAPPPFRMMTDAADLKRWITTVRPLLRSLADTNVKVEPRTITLGNGAYQMEAVFVNYGRRVLFQWRACGPGTGGSGPSPKEFLDFLALLDTAAQMAGGGHGRPPTLVRPYYSIEVSCPVVASTGNERPRAPAGMSPLVGEVATEFVVDTLGRVEPKSIHVMPGVLSALADSVRAAVSRWRFRPAEIDGTIVRQIVQMGVPIGPYQLPPDEWQTIVAGALQDGWVRIRRGDPASRDVNQEFYEPDSIDAFVARVKALGGKMDALSRDTTLPLPQVLLTAPGRQPIKYGLARRGSNLEIRGAMAACDGSPFDVSSIGDGADLIDAARQARRNRETPADQTLSVHDRTDVTCPAWDVWRQSNYTALHGVWQYPVGSYPASMRASSARAEVLTSFVVDTTGDVELNTIQVMPGSDPRAVAEIPMTLAARHFRPARRSGKKVPQFVIEAIRFEPPPTCPNRFANPACPRLYSPR